VFSERKKAFFEQAGETYGVFKMWHRPGGWTTAGEYTPKNQTVKRLNKALKTVGTSSAGREGVTKTDRAHKNEEMAGRSARGWQRRAKTGKECWYRGTHTDKDFLGDSKTKNGESKRRVKNDAGKIRDRSVTGCWDNKWAIQRSLWGKSQEEGARKRKKSTSPSFFCAGVLAWEMGPSGNMTKINGEVS